MVQVTAEFGISGPVEFVDVHVESDNRLFIDPSAIRVAAQRGEPYGVRADSELKVFFDGVLRQLNSVNSADRSAGEESLKHFSEIRETRLGMSKTGFNGHGAARELGARIWNELDSNPLCRQAIATLKFVEDIPLFVERIGKDVTSDITARIVIDTLAAFTADMLSKYPQFAGKRPLADLTTESWDASSGVWTTRKIQCPEADGKPLVLVPKWFVNYKIQMSFGQFYQVPLLGYVQWEYVVQIPRRKGYIIKPRFTKKFLRTRSSLIPGRETNRRQSTRIFEKDGTDILGEYRRGRQAAFVPLSDSEISRRLG